ncbi:acetylornithine aminotransferase [Candidatus Kuenenia stuttgartiensis]|jgi:acetylornithine/N-succinyldiaminopimelate aminotransferase|uniref:Acetylornithine aminotransferase n=1 Tax=Kuenenia stuttgartiensis TaxID=174633 RepID=Q1PX83_KUEST|nr:aspartate aminotransferase family protein [Candidatus Kuenenia stuttgartiensis]MBE7547892.1 aspartate aminotransferase family protein [Planctomycetia bacterium]MCF6152930.1 aspartate aminotransferase family protein [Candidatus Kuenenia stuttgartiensis]QII13663.1 acetylornithine aminotransferase [Candidatus Kuenenia stuttgartiensis]TVL97837.1 MAG: aspartate aminotransferase family protein [Candidatus Kuenenia stuttgartiensis]CAJ71846.1 strongly similar to acetylornithine aminotransferase [Ca
MNTQEIQKIYERYVIPNYIRNPILLVKGNGVEIWDAEGKRYLDLFSGWAVSLLGHCHPATVKAIQNQAAKLQHAPNIYYTEPQGMLAKYISEKSFGGQCFFCNSGAEANEAAIKLARIHNSARGKYKIITFSDSFHGRTIATVTATAQPKYHKGFAPLVEGFSYVPFNDMEALRNAIDDKTCAIMLETIQGEGGINIATNEFLRDIRNICNEKGLLLILDEVQCGMGRTGKYFAYQHYGIEPDIMTLAKALGGGVAIGAMTAKKEVAKDLVPGSHASTFGGNPLACAAGVAVFETIEKENLLDNTKEMGEYAMEQLRLLKTQCNIIKEIRGVGLMIGIELAINGSTIIKECIQAGLFLNCTHDTVIRFMPPLNVKKEHIDEGLGILKSVLSNY